MVKRLPLPLTLPFPQRRASWRRTCRYVYCRLLRLRGTPREMARGLAAGVFAGCFPFFGFQIAIGLVIATLIRGNRLLTIAGTWVSNPFTYVPIFAFNYQVGRWVLASAASPIALTDLRTWQGWWDLGAEVATALLLGSAIVGAVSSVLSYYLGLWLLQHLRSGRRRSYRSRHTTAGQLQPASQSHYTFSAKDGP